MNARECIFFQLAKATQVAGRFWAKRIEHLKVTAVQGMILNFLSEEDHVTSNQLGERTMLDSATLTGIIDRLESGGLIERKPNPEDRRAIQVCLTGEGKKIAAEIRRIVVTANKDFLSSLNQAEEESFRSILVKVRGG